MDVRGMTAQEYELMYRLWAGTPGTGMRSLDDSREGIARFLDRNPNTCFTAWLGDKLIGTILCGHDGRRAYIYHVCVDVDFRGGGVGKLLVEAALSAVKEEGIHRAALVAFKTNELGNGFWEHMGWTLREDLNYYNLSLNEENY